MEVFKRFAKETVKSIDDPFERKQAEKEVYSTLMDAYDEAILTSASQDQAVQSVIDHFGSDASISQELKEAHIRKIGMKQGVMIALICVVILTGLYVLIYLIFSGRIAL